MAPRLLAGNSQKSCSRLSAVHISALHRFDVKEPIFVLPGETQGPGSMPPRLFRGHAQKACSRLSAVHISV